MDDETSRPDIPDTATPNTVGRGAERPPCRVLFHVHTRFSADAWIRPAEIVEYARANDIALVIVTDHDSHLGALACAEQAGGQGPIFPLSAEYRSKLGDMVAMFLSGPLKSRDPDGILDEAHDQGALVVLPHPFKGTPFPDRILEKADIIEVFNARCSQQQNSQAAEAARLLGKPGIAGTDAHFASELGLAVNVYATGSQGNWQDILRMSSPSLQVASTSLRTIRRSQLLGAVRQGRPLKAAGQVVRLLQTPRGLTP